MKQVDNLELLMRGTQSSAQYVGRVSLAVVSTQELLTGTSPGIVMRNFILVVIGLIENSCFETIVFKTGITVASKHTVATACKTP